VDWVGEREGDGGRRVVGRGREKLDRVRVRRVVRVDSRGEVRVCGGLVRAGTW
jgi:hypothetical protein